MGKITAKSSWGLGLLAFASFGVIFAPWLFVPAIVALLFGFVVWLSNTQGALGKYANVLRYGLLVAAVYLAVWTVFFDEPRAVVGMYGVSPLNAALGGNTADSHQPPPVSLADKEWQVFELETTRQTRKLALVGNAMRLYRAADVALANAPGSSNTAELDSALAKLRSQLENPQVPGNKSLSLFSADALDKHVAAAKAALDNLVSEAEAVRQNPAEISKLPDQLIYGQQTAYRIEDLYGAASTLRKALSSTIESKLEPRQRFESRYSRTLNGDELVSTHSVTVDISRLKANRIDLSELIAGIDDDPAKSGITVELEVDGVRGPALTPSAKEQPLDEGAKMLRIIRTVSRSNVAKPVRQSWLPNSVFDVDVTWPLTSGYAITLNVPAYSAASATWPYQLDIELPANATLDRIAVPKHSFFYSAPPMEMTAAADSDELAAPKGLTLKEMKNDKPIRVQVLAKWLSFGQVQAHKDLLFFDNFVLGLLITALAAIPAVKLFQ